MPRRIKPGFIWVPKTMTTVYSILVDSVDITQDVVSAEFTKSVIGLESPCKISLIDSDGTYIEKYKGGEVIEFKMDFSDGSTSQWKGKLESPKRNYKEAYMLELLGSDYQADLLDITVTKEYTGILSADNILKEIIGNYLTGFTYTNVLSSTILPTIKWSNKPFYDCVLDLCNLAEFDCYVDSNKDFHFFPRESIVNNNEALVFSDNLLEIDNLGTDTIEVRNRIIVYGKDSTGLPIIYQTDDLASQAVYGIKEKVISDDDVKTYQQAKDLGDAELINSKETAMTGGARGLFLPQLNQGDMIYIIHPPLKVHDLFRITKLTHYIPTQETSVVVSKEKSIPLIFKERKTRELAQEDVQNPERMQFTYNFIFDDLSDIDATASSNIEIDSSRLRLTAGSTSGIMFSKTKNASADISSVYIQASGESLPSADFYISTNGGVSFETDKTPLNTLHNLSSIGKQLVLKIEIKSSSVLIDGVSLGYK